jgi:excisionase family DNA binding protein
MRRPKTGGRNKKNMNTQILATPENRGQNNTAMGSFNWAYSGQETSLPSPILKSQTAQSGPQPASLVYTIEEAAAVLNVCTKTIRRLISRRHLTCCKVLRKKLIPREQIERFLKATCDVPMTLK